LTGELRGKWGFDDWVGPRFHLHAAQPGKWTLVGGDQSALVVGREDTLHLEDESTLCIDRVEEEVSRRQPAEAGLEVAQAGDAGGNRALEGRGSGTGNHRDISTSG
jgi:hypothetical protein